MNSIREPGRNIPICHEADICVVGGSCTGVFAAVRAARLGLSVAIIEQHSLLGGMATAGQVNEWHSIRAANADRPVIGGLTIEMLDRLRRENAVAEEPPGRRGQFKFNSAVLAGELDDLVRESNGRIRVFFCARCTNAIRIENKITAAIIEDRSGRRAIGARMFIDASGDGDLVRRAGFDARQHERLQPVSMQALVDGFQQTVPWEKLRRFFPAHGYPEANSAPWPFAVPGAPALRNVFGARLNGVDGSNADDMSHALMEARRLHRAYLRMVREFDQPDNARATENATITRSPQIVAWPHALGVRETWHACCRHQLTGDELLSGHKFADAIAQGTYPVDIHSANGVTLKYLDGREETVSIGNVHTWGRWLPADACIPAFYAIPWRSLVPEQADNLLVAGRLIDANREAFGAIRVMVVANQTGEAAGIGAALAIRQGISAADVPPLALRKTLNDGGSLLE